MQGRCEGVGEGGNAAHAKRGWVGGHSEARSLQGERAGAGAGAGALRRTPGCHCQPCREGHAGWLRAAAAAAPPPPPTTVARAQLGMHACMRHLHPTPRTHLHLHAHGLVPACPSLVAGHRPVVHTLVKHNVGAILPILPPGAQQHDLARRAQPAASGVGRQADGEEEEVEGRAETTPGKLDLTDV